MSFGFAVSDVVQLVANSTRIYLAFKDTDDHSDASGQALIREFGLFHKCLLELAELMNEYANLLPIPYHDFRETLQQIEKMITPVESIATEKVKSRKKFIFQPKNAGKEKEIDNLRATISGHRQVLQMCISFLQLRLHLDTTRQSKRLLDRASIRSTLWHDFAHSRNNSIQHDTTESDTLPISSEADGLYKDWLIFDRWLKNVEDELGQVTQASSIGDAPQSNNQQTVALLNHLRREVEDAIKIEENRPKRIAAERKISLFPREEVRQEMRDRLVMRRRTHSLDTDDTENLSLAPNIAMGTHTDVRGSTPLTPLSASPHFVQQNPNVIDLGDLSLGDADHDIKVIPHAAATTPEPRLTERTLSNKSLATVALEKDVLEWQKLCSAVKVERKVERTAFRRKEARSCDVHWRYEDDTGLSLRSVYHDRFGLIRTWITQHFPATGPPIPLTMSHPDGDVSIDFPGKSFGKLERQYTDVRYTFANREDSRRFQELLYTNGGKEKAQLLYDCPVLTISSNLNKPEGRGRNVRLWRKTERNTDVLILLFYTSALPEDKAHWVEEPHYAFEWLGKSVKTHSDNLTLTFSKKLETRTSNSLIEIQESYNDKFSKDQIQGSGIVDSTHRLDDTDDIRSSMSMRTNSSWTDSVSGNSMKRSNPNGNRFGYDRLEIKFENHVDRMAFVDIWTSHAKPTLHIAPTPSKSSESERHIVNKFWTRSETNPSNASMQSTSWKLTSTNPTSIYEEVAESSHPQVQEGTSELKIEENDDIWSVISEVPRDDEGSPGHIPPIRMDQWRDEIINGIITVLATNESLTPLYERAAQLIPQDRFVKNFRRLLMTFRNDLADLPKTRVTQELSAILRPEGTQRKIVDGVISRQMSSGSPLDDADVARIQDSDESIFSKLERLFSDSQIHFPPPETPHNLDLDDEEANFDPEKEEIPLDPNLSQRTRVDQVIQTLVLGQPFQDMISGLREFLLPHGLLNDILPIPRDHIKYDTSEKSPLLNRAKGWLEDITGLEWDWWPLTPRMRTLSQGETRVYWRCFCGKVRSRILKSAQKDVLEDTLQQPPAMYQRPLFCASFTSLAAHTRPHSPNDHGQPSNPSSASNGTHLSPASGSTSQISNNLLPNQTSHSAPLALNGNTSTQNHYIQKKSLWFIFKIEGPRAAPMWDQFGDEDLGTDRLFQQRLKQRHHRLRGWLRLWLSYWRLSYWEFVKLQKTRPGRLVDRGLDLPLGGEYDYHPRPPKVTAQDPWISKHEFEEIVNSCITPCWLGSLPTFLGLHDCACPEADSNRLVEALPKRNSEFVIDSSTDKETYVWGIHARYVVSGLYVFLIHVGILVITFGFWIWWQRKHPDDLQGASVPVTVAGICVSTFWASTGILKGLR